MSELTPSKRAPDDAGLVDAQSRLSKRNSIFPIATPRSENGNRRNSEGSLLDFFGALCLSTPSMETLPQELLLQVFEHLVHHSLVTAGFPEHKVSPRVYEFDDNDQPDQCGYVSAVNRRDLHNVCLVSRKFNMAATTLLYRCAHLTTVKSVQNFLLTLNAHPDLQPLVKHISVPTHAGRITKQFNFAFRHDRDHYYYNIDNLPRVLRKEFFAENGGYFRGSVLTRMISLVPNLRTLVIPQANLLDGPFTRDMVLPNLTTLRVTTMVQNEVFWYRVGFPDAVRTVTWMNPGFIGHRFPALQRLEISTPCSRWEADLVSEEGDAGEGGSPRKYVESLGTITTYSSAPADWDLMSLEQPIFHPSKLRTLEFAGPGEDCIVVAQNAMMGNWDLNRFFAEKCNGLQTLLLKWEVHDLNVDDDPHDSKIQKVYFGPEGRLHTLDTLTNLTHLTVSLQALFCFADIFWDWVDKMENSPDKELAKLLPPSLRTLRIAEYIPGVFEGIENYEVNEVEHEDIIDVIRHQSDCVFRFLQALRHLWLLRANDRELWLRCHIPLDLLEDENEVNMGRGRIHGIIDHTVEEDGDFEGPDGAYELILRPPEDAVWGPEGRETIVGPDEGTAENEDQDADGGPDQWSDGEKVGVYQDGKLVLM